MQRRTIMPARKPLTWGALCCAVAPMLALAGDIADSTGTVRARRALVLPDTVTEETVTRIVTNITNQVVDPGVPAGYVEYTINAGPHPGSTPTYPNVTYGRVQYFAGCDDFACERSRLDASLCGGDLSHRVIELLNDSAYTMTGRLVYGYYTCEPIGKVTGLIKANMASITTISQSQVNRHALAGTIGVNTSGAEPICRALGFTNYVPGTVASWYKGGGCPGGYVTQYRNGTWVSDTACYNNILTGMQCYR
jgi:hypothetical protein